MRPVTGLVAHSNPQSRMSLSPYPAGLLRRLAAACYDLLLMVALWFVAVFALLPFTHGYAIDGSNLWFRLYLFVLPYLFFSWFWTHGGQTVGMRAWRLRLRNSEGGAVTGWQALLRYLAAWVSWLSVIGIVWCLFDARKRCLQDIASRTQVVTLPKAR